MKKALFIFSTIALLFSACGKDDPINPEAVLYKRLAKQGGVWTVEKLEHYSFNADGTEVLDSTYYRERQYVFYEHSEVLDYGSQTDFAYLAVAVLNKGVGGTKYSLWAEGNRIIFDNSTLGPQYTFTVRENKPNTQVWEVYNAQPSFERTVVYLKHCPNCEPYYAPYEISSI